MKDGTTRGSFTRPETEEKTRGPRGTSPAIHHADQSAAPPMPPELAAQLRRDREEHPPMKAEGFINDLQIDEALNPRTLHASGAGRGAHR